MKLSAQLANVEKELTIDRVDGVPGRWRLEVDGAGRLVDARQLGPTTWSLLLGDRVVTVDVEPGKDGELLVDVRGTVVPVKLVDARRRLLEKAQASVAAHHGPTAITAPMSGKLVKILVKVGEAVASGQPVAVVEAMKMENEIRAPRAGTVLTIHAQEGQAVEGQEALVTVD